MKKQGAEKGLESKSYVFTYFGGGVVAVKCRNTDFREE